MSVRKNFLFYIILLSALTGCGTVQGSWGNKGKYEVIPGMTKDEVLAYWGVPDTVYNSENSRIYTPNKEAWHYKGFFMQMWKPDKSVYFHNDIVTKVFVGRYEDRYLLDKY